MQIGLVVVGMQGFDLILSLLWLKKHHPLIDFGDGVWLYYYGSLGIPHIINTATLIVTIQYEGAQILAI